MSMGKIISDIKRFEMILWWSALIFDCFCYIRKQSCKTNFRTRLGAVVDRIGQCVKFKQEAWLASYISLNTQKRQAAKNNFEKNFYKLLNNRWFSRFIICLKCVLIFITVFLELIRNLQNGRITPRTRPH
jgi:hypothetical protein